jgi:hypothetical protein
MADLHRAPLGGRDLVFVVVIVRPVFMGMAVLMRMIVSVIVLVVMI